MLLRKETAVAQEADEKQAPEKIVGDLLVIEAEPVANLVKIPHQAAIHGVFGIEFLLVIAVDLPCFNLPQIVGEAVLL